MGHLPTSCKTQLRQPRWWTLSGSCTQYVGNTRIRAPQPGGSRLDRIYLQQANCNFVARATIHIASPSDHRLALLHITPRHPPPTWKAPRRLRLYFLTHPDLKRTLAEWLDEQEAASPNQEGQPHQAALDGWMGFKRSLTAKIASLNREAQTRRCCPTATVQQLTTAAQEAASALDADPSDAGRLAAAVTAQVEVQKGMRAAVAAEVLMARRAWIKDGERPSKVLTALVHEPKDGGSGGGGPAQLHDPGTGQVTRDPSQLAQIIANFWRDVSA